MRLQPSLLLLALVAAACGSVTSIADASGQGGSGGRHAGTGGKGGGGTGSGGSTGTSCSQLESDYAAELVKAKSCSPNASDPCAQMAPNALACGCQTFVNDRSALDQIQSRWNQSGCQATTVCPAIACVTPKSAACRPADGGGATCQDMLLAAP